MLKVIFCGTPDISTLALKALIEHPEVEIQYVISQPDRPSGRGNHLKSPEVIELAKSMGIRTFQTQNINKEIDFLNTLEALKPDLFIVFAFAQFLGKRVLSLPKLGCFNIHTSLLPRYRGAAPIHYAILNGDSHTGVSIQKMVKQMDAGDICLDQQIDISSGETTESLYEKLKVLASKTIVDFINATIGHSLTFRPQDESLASFAPTIKKDEGYIDFQIERADGIERKLRAFTPWPGVQCLVNNKRCKILALKQSDRTLEPGQIYMTKDQFFIGCLGGCVELLKVQLEGKQAVDIATWINGLQGQMPVIGAIKKD